MRKSNVEMDCACSQDISGKSIEVKVATSGGEVAGLYCGYPLKHLQPEADIHLVEENPSNAAVGFG